MIGGIDEKWKKTCLLKIINIGLDIGAGDLVPRGLYFREDIE